MRGEQFRARDKKVQKLTRDGLVEQNKATGEDHLVGGPLHWSRPDEGAGGGPPRRQAQAGAAAPSQRGGPGAGC